MVRPKSLIRRLQDRLRWMRILVALVFVAAIPVANLPSLAATGTDRSSSPSSDVSIVVLTANLGNGLADPAELENVIREHDADIVALQEVTPDIADAIRKNLTDLLPYQEIRDLGIPGKALLSRYPITKVEWLEINPGRPDLRATIEIAGQAVETLVVHPTPPELSGGLVNPREGSAEQFDRLVEIAAKRNLPFLMLGDFNMIPIHERHFDLESLGLQDAFEQAGSGVGFTYPQRIPPLPDWLVFPIVRIDYIWASEEWEVLSAAVGSDIGSDHLPVIAELAIEGTS